MQRILWILQRLPLGAEALLALSLASMRLAVRSQSRSGELLGESHGSGATSPTAAQRSGGADRSAEAMRIGHAVERVARVLPWRPVCLPQAVAVAWMLRRRGISCRTHLGFKSVRPPSAHAWVTVGGAIVQGAPVEDVIEIASFVGAR